MTPAGYTCTFYRQGNWGSERRWDWQGISQLVSGRLNQKRSRTPPPAPRCLSRTLTIGFAMSDAGDKLLVGLFPNPAIEHAATVPIAGGMATTGNILQS